jgi:Domain of unknown function (DUF4442)
LAKLGKNQYSSSFRKDNLRLSQKQIHMISKTITTPYFDPNSETSRLLIRSFQNNFKLFFYFLKRLPSAAWWGFRVKSCSHLRSEVTIPYSWRTKNPFRSIYFAALAGAGEFSTGMLCLIAMQNRKDIAMLVVKQEATFSKKATGLITFTCEDGAAVIEVMQRVLDTGEAVPGVGRNEQGDEVCRVMITWSFKWRKGVAGKPVV